MSRTVRVAVFNATGGSNRSSREFFATWYARLLVDIAIVSEVFRFRRVLATLGHYRGGRKGHGREDVGVITRRRPASWRQVQLTRFVQRPGADKPLLWHDRWLTRVAVGLLFWDRIVVLSSHAPAVIQNYGTRTLASNPGAREWREHGLPRLEAMLARAARRNRAVVHGWDANQRPGDGPENPAQMYARHGMKWINDGVMWLGWNPRRLRLLSHDVLGTPPGSDGHKTLLAEFEFIPLHRRLAARLAPTTKETD